MALKKVMRELASPLCSLSYEDMLRNQQSATQKGLLPEPDHASILISDLQAPELRNKFLWFIIRPDCGFTAVQTDGQLYERMRFLSVFSVSYWIARDVHHILV